MLNKTIKLNRHLWERVQRCAADAGYSSPQEFVEHALEQALGRLEKTVSKDDTLKKLKGLGYIE
jgi:metal-responsive CopG/Arc/MetJ family transcriptional regulator